MSYLRDDLAAAWQGRDPIAAAQALQGEVFREVANRRTLRVHINGAAYFLKLHMGVGWREIFKNWLSLKPAVLGAANEYDACRYLEELKIPAPRPAAFAQRGCNPAKRISFIVCDELSGYESLEDVTGRWLRQPATLVERRRVLRAVARFARRFHAAGLIHRDFYICHLLADTSAYASGEVQLAVLDLHRARRFRQVPRRWLVRDVAALVFSALDLNYSRSDWCRFVRLYSGKPVRRAFTEDAAFWRAVWARARKLYQQGLQDGTVLGLYKQ